MNFYFPLMKGKRCKCNQTLEKVFQQDIQTLRSGMKKRGAAESFFFLITDLDVF